MLLNEAYSNTSSILADIIQYWHGLVSPHSLMSHLQIGFIHILAKQRNFKLLFIFIVTLHHQIQPPIQIHQPL